MPSDVNLTLDAIRAMTPRERDARIFRYVFNCTVLEMLDPPHYSTDPAASAELKAALWKTGKYSSIVTRIFTDFDLRRSMVEVSLFPLNWPEEKEFIYSIPLSDDPARDECECLSTVVLLAVSATEGT